MSVFIGIAGATSEDLQVGSIFVPLWKLLGLEPYTGKGDEQELCGEVEATTVAKALNDDVTWGRVLLLAERQAGGHKPSHTHYKRVVEELRELAKSAADAGKRLAWS
jgi:hypothetical protein